jgi:hypothetical protein
MFGVERYQWFPGFLVVESDEMSNGGVDLLHFCTRTGDLHWVVGLGMVCLGFELSWLIQHILSFFCHHGH